MNSRIDPVHVMWTIGLMFSALLLVIGMPLMVKMSGESKSKHQIACLEAGGNWLPNTGDCVNEITINMLEDN